MGLYKHVGSVDELYLLMADQAVGLPPDIAPAQDWRQVLGEWAHALLQVYTPTGPG